MYLAFYNDAEIGHLGETIDEAVGALVEYEADDAHGIIPASSIRLTEAAPVVEVLARDLAADVSDLASEHWFELMDEPLADHVVLTEEQTKRVREVLLAVFGEAIGHRNTYAATRELGHPEQAVAYDDDGWRWVPCTAAEDNDRTADLADAASY